MDTFFFYDKVILLFLKIACYLRRLSRALKLTPLQSKNIYYVFLNFVEKYVKKESWYYYNYHYWICLNMSECAYINMILYMPLVVNTSNFWIWQNSEYDRVLNMRALHSILNILNMREYALTEFWIYLGF